MSRNRGRRTKKARRVKRVSHEPCELLLLGLPRDIFYYIVDLGSLGYDETKEFIKYYETLMLVNKRIKQLMIFYIKKKYNLFDFFSNEDTNFELHPQVIFMLDKIKGRWINSGIQLARRIFGFNNIINSAIILQYFFLNIFEKFVKNPEIQRQFPNILEKITFLGPFVNNLYQKSIELSINSPKKTLEKIIENNIIMKSYCLNIYVNDNDCDIYQKIINYLAQTMEIFRIYSKTNIKFLKSDTMMHRRLFEIPILQSDTAFVFSVGSLY